MKRKKLDPVHPGEILFEEFMKPMGLTQYQLAKDISVPTTRIAEIVHRKRAISADTALRLSRYFGMSREFWIGLQKRYELDVAEDLLADKLDVQVQPRAA